MSEPDNIRRLPLRAVNEPYLDRETLARKLTMHVNTLDRLRKEPGFPQENWGLRTPRFQHGLVLEWLRARGHRRAA